MVLTLYLQACTVPRIIVVDDPLTPEEHINLGLSYERKGEFDLAEKEFMTASEKLPAAYVYLGNLYYVTERPERAEKYYRKAIAEDPRNADALNNLAWLFYTKRENLDEAEQLVIQAIEMDTPKNGMYLDTLEHIRALKKSP